MRRPLVVWLIFGVCLVAATAAVGWLTQSAWRSDQARQQALFDSEIRNALWRMDSLAAPLLAMEITRPSFSVPFRNTPVLASKLVKGYVVRDAAGHWTIRRDGRSRETQPLETASPLIREDWLATLDQTPPLWHTLAATSTEQSLDDLVVWPTGSANAKLASQNVATSGSQNRSQLVQQVQQFVAIGQGGQQGGPPSQDAVAVPNIVPSHAIWIGKELVLARRLPGSPSGVPSVELCWLNWPEWEALLQAQLEGLSTQVRLVPMQPHAAARSEHPWQMASLPIQLEPVSNRLPASWPFPLLAVWGLLLSVAVAIGWLIRETLNLSERRAAFVSAVTHELRTPLTTFRLYTEMLSEGLATDPEQRQVYFQTLHREANRLTHLVENVLAYARLEHGRPTARHESLTVGELFDRCVPRLQQRVAETALTLEVNLPETTRPLKLLTNALAVEQVLFNLIDNCCKYANDATDPRILCEVETTPDAIQIRVRDFGPGLSPSARRSLFRPFQKSSSEAAETAPGVGLGLALSQRLARDLGGSLRCGANTPCGLSFELTLPIAS